MTRKLSLVGTAGAVVLALAATGCGALQPRAATVNGDRISQRAIDDELEAIADNASYRRALGEQFKVLGQGAGTVDARFAAVVLTGQVRTVLIRQELRRLHLTVSAADLRKARAAAVRQVGGQRVFDRFPRSYRDDLVQRQAESEEFQTAVVTNELSDAAVSRYYVAHKSDFDNYCIRHVLLQDEEGAVAAMSQIESGVDMGAVAVSRSRDPTAVQNRGDLGCASLDTYDPVFSAAARRLAVGQLSGPVQTRFGWHIILVYGRRERPLAEVTDQIRQVLSQQFARRVLGRAHVEVNPKYGTYEDDQIVPPKSVDTTAPGTVTAG